MTTSDDQISNWRRCLCFSFRHDVMALLLAPFVEALTMYVVDKGV